MYSHEGGVQERNKPLQPPKKPEAAPFFLPTTAGVQRDVQFDMDAAAAHFAARRDGDGAGAPPPGMSQRRGPKHPRGGPSGDPVGFVALLRRCGEAGDWAPLVLQLRGMPPSAIDMELRSMQVRVDLSFCFLVCLCACARGCATIHH